MRIVVDTDVLVSGVRSKSGASRAIIRLIESQRIIALATVGIVIEYEAVLKRSEHLKAAHMTVHDVDKLLDTLIVLIEPVTPHFIWRPQLKDPNDEMILEAAANGRADAIVTFNLRHFAKISSRFGIETLEPVDVLRRVLI